MKCPFSHEDLEAYALGLSPEPRAREIKAHVAGCSNCRDEIDWLRLEQMVFEERGLGRSEDTAALWNGIEERIADSPEDAGESEPEDRGRVVSLGARQRVAWFGSGFAASAMAAAVLLLYLRAPQVAEPTPASASLDAGAAEEASLPAPTPSDPAMASLDQAETQYQEAIATLEAEYAARRRDLPAEVVTAHERAFQQGRRLIENARKDAGNDVDARLRVLDAYSSHLRTVQSVMSEMPDSA